MSPCLLLRVAIELGDDLDEIGVIGLTRALSESSNKWIEVAQGRDLGCALYSVQTVGRREPILYFASHSGVLTSIHSLSWCTPDGSR